MITFACKKISLEDVVRCSFNLNKTEYRLFVFLFGKEREFSVQAIARETRLERTTVQKALKGLLKKKLAERRQTNIKNGGYFFLYKVGGKTEIKEKLLNIIRQWQKSVEKEILKM